MGDKSMRKSNDKKRGKSLHEKRMAKRQKRSEREATEQARNRVEGL